jgi:hypothetical protein
MTEYLNGKELPLSELQLADCVEAFDGPYGTAIVKKIEDGLITFFRPYGANASFSYTGGVICYMGIEEFTRSVTPRETIRVWRREKLA